MNSRFFEFFIPKLIDIPFVVLTLLAGHYIISAVVTRHKCYQDRGLLVKLFYYHLFFCLVYVAYILKNGGDAIGYWRPPILFLQPGQSFISLHKPGTSFIYLFTYPFAQVLGLSLWGGTIVFSLFGFGGVVCIYLTMRRTFRVVPTAFGYKLLPLVLFLPNMHFWSSGVGKDTVIFFAIALFIYSLTNVKKNLASIVIGFYLAFFIRPHIALVLLIAGGLALVLSSEGVSAFWRVTLISTCIVVFLVIAPTVYQFIGVEEDSIESYEDVANIRSKNLSRQYVGSKIEISTYPIPLKIFTFLYRPLFIDSVNALGFVVSFENLLYLFLSVSIFRASRLRAMLSLPVVYKACTIIVLATSYFMSSSLSNLGIIVRQKNMVMFLLVMVCLYIISEDQYKKQVLRSKSVKRRVPSAPNFQNELNRRPT